MHIFSSTIKLFAQCALLGVLGIIAATANQKENELEIRLAPGDDKSGYDSQSYTTNSLSLENRTGEAVDLFLNTNKKHLGLPRLKIEGLSKEKIELGRKLFFDRRLSRNKTMSCAMCHIPEQGFTNNELERPIGFQGRGLKRNAPTILNVAFMERLFADARESKLEQQVWSPLLAENEMNNPSVGAVIDIINSNSDYAGMFEKAFGEPANMLNIGHAIAMYESSLVSANSRFDQWLFANNKNALNEQEIKGYSLFVGKAACINCHSINFEQKTALFTDNLLHNTGVGYRDSMLPAPQKITVQVAPGITTVLDKKVLDSVGNEKPNDVGQYEVTLNPLDRWKYRTPSLRNVALTAPYMHDGKFLSLEDVVRFYNNGGEPNELLSPMIKPLGLNKDEQDSLVAFLKSLNGQNLVELVADAFAAPIGDQ